jgi:hypothetical protein
MRAAREILGHLHTCGLFRFQSFTFFSILGTSKIASKRDPGRSQHKRPRQTTQLQSEDPIILLLLHRALYEQLVTALCSFRFPPPPLFLGTYYRLI